MKEVIRKCLSPKLQTVLTEEDAYYKWCESVDMQYYTISSDLRNWEEEQEEYNSNYYQL